MLSQLFLGISLAGAEWVLYSLLIISILSIALIFERVRFYREATRGLRVFREQVRHLVQNGKWEDAVQLARTRSGSQTSKCPDLESEMSFVLLSRFRIKENAGNAGADVLTEIAQDSVFRARLAWDRNLSILATIGTNAPFVGLFGTVLGIIKAFHDLSRNQGAAALQAAPEAVTSGISEALVATAFGLLVAIPAVVAFNLFQRKVRSALVEADAFRCFLIGKLADSAKF